MRGTRSLRATHALARTRVSLTPFGMTPLRSTNGRSKNPQPLGLRVLVSFVAPALPDSHPVFGCEVEFLARFDVEGCVPRVNVTNGGRAISRRGMRVGQHLVAQG